MRENPDSDARLSRKDWYSALSKDVPGIADGSETAGKINDVLTSWTPPKKKVIAGDRVLAAKEGERAINAVDTLKDVDWEDPNVAEYVANLPRLTDKDVTKALAASGAPSIVNINGKVYRVKGIDNVGGGVKHDYIRLEDKDGKVVWIQHATGTVLDHPPLK